MFQYVISGSDTIGFVLGQGKTFRAYSDVGRPLGLYETVRLATTAVYEANDRTCCADPGSPITDGIKD
jgi:hypothetical protein